MYWELYIIMYCELYIIMYSELHIIMCLVMFNHFLTKKNCLSLFKEFYIISAIKKKPDVILSSKFLFGIFFSENHFYQNLKYYTSMYVHSSYIKDDDSYFIIEISIITDMVEKYIHFFIKKKKK